MGKLITVKDGQDPAVQREIYFYTNNTTVADDGDLRAIDTLPEALAINLTANTSGNSSAGYSVEFLFRLFGTLMQAIASSVTSRFGTNGAAAAADGTQAQQLRAIAEGLSLASPTTAVLTDFIIGSGASVSNFVLLAGRAFLLRTPTGLQGASLYFRVRFVNGAGSGDRLTDRDGIPFSIPITTTQTLFTLPFLVDAIGSEIALETAVDLTNAATQSASRTLQIKTLR